MELTIITPEKTVFNGSTDSITVPGTKGIFEILNNHAPIISSLQKGVIVCKGQKSFQVEIQKGFIEVANNKITICAEI